MGWFWADTAPSAHVAVAPVAPHPMPRGNAEPPVCLNLVIPQAHNLTVY
jgi:hypothetical protein